MMDGIQKFTLQKDPHQYELICEGCGSLTITLPAGTSPDSHALLKCGRCGLQSLRDRSIGASFFREVGRTTSVDFDARHGLKASTCSAGRRF